MGMKSKQKGKVGEREARDVMIRVLGCDAKRGVQHSGGKDSPDIIHSIDGLHVEVKRCETLSVYTAMDQAMNDAGDKVPLVMHRRNNRQWLAIVNFEQLPQLVKLLAPKEPRQ